MLKTFSSTKVVPCIVAIREFTKQNNVQRLTKEAIENLNLFDCSRTTEINAMTMTWKFQWFHFSTCREVPEHLPIAGRKPRCNNGKEQRGDERKSRGTVEVELQAAAAAGGRVAVGTSRQSASDHNRIIIIIIIIGDYGGWSDDCSGNYFKPQSVHLLFVSSAHLSLSRYLSSLYNHMYNHTV